MRLRNVQTDGIRTNFEVHGHGKLRVRGVGGINAHRWAINLVDQKTGGPIDLELTTEEVRQILKMLPDFLTDVL